MDRIGVSCESKGGHTQRGKKKKKANQRAPLDSAARKRLTAAAVPHAATSSKPPAITSAKGTVLCSTSQPNDSAMAMMALVVTDFKIDADAGTTSLGLAETSVCVAMARKLEVENSSMF
jgi:hypothetical protein